MALQGSGKMRRQHPRILGSLRNPLPLPLPLQTPPLYFFPASVHLIPSQPSSLHPAIYVHPLSVFYPTSFPTLKNTFYFPTLMMAMPSSSCLAKLSANRPAVFQPSSYLSTLMTTPPRRVPLERYLVSLSHPEADCPQLDWELRKNSPDMEPGIEGNELAPTSLVQGKQPPETQTGNQEAEESQALVKFGAFTQ
ncbi:uncharacterized protein LOC106143962 isoform X3 [Microtus ochrogaster]|nr:uncharacterized protein LOC106143962 isoform X3 [Microtus ochrogaster]